MSRVSRSFGTTLKTIKQWWSICQIMHLGSSLKEISSFMYSAHSIQRMYICLLILHIKPGNYTSESERRNDWIKPRDKKKLIESTFIYKSRYFCSHRLLATSGRILWMLKKKSPGVRKLKERIQFQASLARFEEKPNVRVRRLSVQSNLDHSIRQRVRDEIMEDNKEEEMNEE